jgi:DNA-binding transcriptional regulator YdaS (Cro superfamily)
MRTSNQNPAVARAVELSGNNGALLAREVGVTPGMVSQWLHGRRPVPPERCVVIERVTKGEVTRRHLRPDDWHLIWPELVTPETAQRELLGSGSA